MAQRDAYLPSFVVHVHQLLKLEFEQVRRGKRPTFQFEAKRVRSTASLRAYLGHGGLCCFLDGRYAADHDIAGMLGYIQSGTAEQRAAELASALDKHPSVRPGGRWRPETLVAALMTYRTQHQRSGRVPPITILHSLLVFC